MKSKICLTVIDFAHISISITMIAKYLKNFSLIKDHCKEVYGGIMFVSIAIFGVLIPFFFLRNVALFYLFVYRQKKALQS